MLFVALESFEKTRLTKLQTNTVNSEFWYMCIFLCSFKGWHLSNYFVPNKNNPWDEIEWRNFPGLPKSWHFWKIILWQRFMNVYLFFSCCAPGDRCDGGPGQNSLRSDAAVPIGRTNPHSLLQRRIWKTSLQVTMFRCSSLYQTVNLHCK